MVDSPFFIEPASNLRLKKVPTERKQPYANKEGARPAVEKNLAQIAELQELLYAEGKHAVLIVLQAMDAGGKDGTIAHVFRGVNPQGCSVTSFKVPSEEERAHDYLWRVHRATPRKGMIGVFNRSHYESVLVERVKNLVARKTWQRRYEHINEFEKLLADEGTTILKFFLHISKQEQKRRLEARLAAPHKHWKFNPDDVTERQHWDDYMAAYEDALSKCSTEHAPWYVIPSDLKWYRNWAVGDIIARTLASLKMKYPPAPPGLDKVVVK